MLADKKGFDVLEKNGSGLESCSDVDCLKGMNSPRTGLELGADDI